MCSACLPSKAVYQITILPFVHRIQGTINGSPLIFSQSQPTWKGEGNGPAQSHPISSLEEGIWTQIPQVVVQHANHHTGCPIILVFLNHIFFLFDERQLISEAETIKLTLAVHSDNLLLYMKSIKLFFSVRRLGFFPSPQLNSFLFGLHGVCLRTDKAEVHFV